MNKFNCLARSSKDGKEIFSIGFIATFREKGRVQLTGLYTNWAEVRHEESPEKKVRILTQEELSELETYEIEIPGFELKKLEDFYESKQREELGKDKHKTHIYEEKSFKGDFLCCAIALKTRQELTSIIEFWVTLNVIQAEQGEFDMNGSDVSDRIKNSGISTEVELQEIKS